VLVGVSALGVPALALLARATALWQVALLVGLLWFSGGAALAHFNLFIGFASSAQNRGRSFSLNSLAFPLGALFGGATIGALATRYGYPTVFGALAALWAMLPLIGLAAPHARVGSTLRVAAHPAGRNQARLGAAFYLLLGSSVLSMTAINSGRLGLPLSMLALHFAPSAIAVTTVVSGLLSIPAVLLIGMLSDRLDRTRLLSLVYGLIVIAALMLTVARLPWHFWAAATLMLVALCANGALTLALAADMLGKERLGRVLPRVSSSNAVASIVTSASTGYLMDAISPAAVFLGAAVLGLLAILQVQALGWTRRAAAAVRLEPARPGSDVNLPLSGIVSRRTAGC
jgi:MFS family permease